MQAIPDIFKENRRLAAPADRVMLGAGAFGAAGLLASLLIAAFVEDGWSRFLYSYLVSFCFLGNCDQSRCSEQEHTQERS